MDYMDRREFLRAAAMGASALSLPAAFAQDKSTTFEELTREQVALIKQWIAAGAKTARPEPAELGKGGGITEEERAFWSFQPIRQPKVPATKRKDRVRTPIDAFLLVQKIFQ